MRKAWGCETVSAMSVPTYAEEENGEQIGLISCPIRFVPPSVYSFLEYYDYAKQFQSAPMPTLDNMAPRFRQAMRYFENQMSIMAEEMRKNG